MLQSYDKLEAQYNLWQGHVVIYIFSKIFHAAFYWSITTHVSSVILLNCYVDTGFILDAPLHSIYLFSSLTLFLFCISCTLFTPSPIIPVQINFEYRCSRENSRWYSVQKVYMHQNSFIYIFLHRLRYKFLHIMILMTSVLNCEYTPCRVKQLLKMKMMMMMTIDDCFSGFLPVIVHFRGLCRSKYWQGFFFNALFHSLKFLDSQQFKLQTFSRIFYFFTCYIFMPVKNYTAVHVNNVNDLSVLFSHSVLGKSFQTFALSISQLNTIQVFVSIFSTMSVYVILASTIERNCSKTIMTTIVWVQSS